MSSFEIAIERVLKHEGGYVNNPADKGGETNYGISKRSYPNLDIKNLSLDQAKAIYKRDFWDRGKYALINNDLVAAKVFDLSVNMGASQAIKILQRALRACDLQVAEDGILGSQTLVAINTMEPGSLIIALRSEVAGFYRSLVAAKPSQVVFLNGWLNRAYA